MTHEEFASYCKDICPHCATNAPVRLRVDTGETVHDFITDLGGGGRSHAHVFCLASNFRAKWKDRLDG